MKIANANLQMASTHMASQRHEIRESLRLWAGNSQPSPQPGDSVRISDQGKSLQSSDSEAVEKKQRASELEPRMQLLKTLLEFLTGRQIKVFDASELDVQTSKSSSLEAGQQLDKQEAAPQQAAGYGLEYDYHETYSETEQTTFSAKGIVRTADGAEVKFDISLSMQRSYSEESNVSLRLGDAARKTDPLVLNFSGSAAQLTNMRFSFDIDSNGKDEQINFAGPGSGFLVLDRNQDGKINNGSEMFGPASGSGFGELAELDSDHNGWIDENDPAFKNLRVWSKDQAGNDQLQALAATGVGALALTCVNTPFDIKDYAGSTSGQIKSSGIFLQEDGKAGTIQQVDLTI